DFVPLLVQELLAAAFLRGAGLQLVEAVEQQVAQVGYVASRCTRRWATPALVSTPSAMCSSWCRFSARMGESRRAPSPRCTFGSIPCSNPLSPASPPYAAMLWRAASAGA